MKQVLLIQPSVGASPLIVTVGVDCNIAEMIVTLRCGKITASIHTEAWKQALDLQIQTPGLGANYNAQSGVADEGSHHTPPHKNGGGIGPPYGHQPFGYADTQPPIQ